MFEKILNIINRKNRISILERNFEPNYFINNSHQDFFNKNGYVKIENIIPNESITELENSFNQLEKMQGYSLAENFVNSGRFSESSIRNFVVDTIRNFAENNLNSIFNTNNCHIANGGNFQIKPSSKKSLLNPHQDSPVIDETKFYGIFIWIPLCNINLDNGPIWVLPKSHLWGNHQRSLNVQWQFEKHHKLMMKNMQPIIANIGDIICFDTALIHASSANTSGKTRVAITTSALPKNYELIEYFKDKKTPKNKVEKYIVTESFYKNENINQRPDAKYSFIGFEDLKYNDVTKNELNLLINYTN